MLEYVGDSFSLISSRGEMVVAILTTATWLGYVAGELRCFHRDSLQHILWFSFWLAQFLKSVRSDTFTLLGNGMIVLLGFAIFLLAIRRKHIGSDPPLVYLMICVLLYTAGSLTWFHNARNLRLFFTGAVLWWVVLLYFRSQDTVHFFRCIFSGFGWLLVYTVVLVFVFTLFLPADGSSETGLAGPFRQNELARSLFVLLVGLFYRHYVAGDIRPELFHLAWPANLLASALTLSRSGMVLSYLFLVSNLGALTRAQRYFMLVVACSTVGVLLFHPDFTDRLRHRFLETGDGGRVEGIQLVIEEGKRELMFGHGFMRSAIDEFQASPTVDRERGYSSHCFFASIFYEFGIIGSLIYAALHAAVFLRLLLAARHCLSYRFALVSFVCFCVSGLFENSSWWPTTPLGLLASIMIVMASGAARPHEMGPADLYLPPETQGMELAGTTGYPAVRLGP